ncbi:MAG TPA: glucosaminidase domain-containing protein [Gaiellaceae bacterium]|nr:glucosaminidase domain-containing protein [Gaiellaceae bacterium]
MERAQEWARANGATPAFVRLAPLYWELAPERGVRPEIAYAQSAKETAFGRFGGVLNASFHNPCGLKRTAGGGNFDRSAHGRFATWRQGVIAHLDHLALYAGVRGYPKRATPDPRHFGFLRGRAHTVEALGGAWAPSVSYGEEVVAYAHEIGLAPPPPAEPPVEPAPHFAEGAAV